MFQQAIGDGGQGWGNVILYIFTSEKFRKRLFGWKPVCVRDSKQVDHQKKPIIRGSKEQHNKYAAINNYCPTTVNNAGDVPISVTSCKAMAYYTQEHSHVNRETLSEFSHEPTTEFGASTTDDT